MPKAKLALPEIAALIEFFEHGCYDDSGGVVVDWKEHARLLKMLRELDSAQTKIDCPRQELADERLAFEHANKVVGRLEKSIAKANARADRYHANWQKAEVGLGEARAARKRVAKVIVDWRASDKKYGLRSWRVDELEQALLIPSGRRRASGGKGGL